MEKPAYFVFNVKVMNPEGMKPYQEKVLATVTAFNGVPVVAGGAIEVREGEAPKGRTIIVRFNSMADARAWYDSPAYQAIIGYRIASAECSAYLLEGIAI